MEPSEFTSNSGERGTFLLVKGRKATSYEVINIGEMNSVTISVNPKKRPHVYALTGNFSKTRGVEALGSHKASTLSTGTSFCPEFLRSYLD